jgi:PST family polysaccharide transporter
VTFVSGGGVSVLPMESAERDQAWVRALPPFLRAKLAGRHQPQKIIGNVGWLFADRILRMGVGLVVGALVAQYLGPSQFGLFSYALAFVALFGTFATLGLDSVVIREIVRDASSKYETLGTAFVLKLLGGGLTLLLSLGAISLLRPGDGAMHWVVGAVAVGTCFQSFDVIDFWFQSQVQSKYTVWARNTAFVAIALVRLLLVRAGAPLLAFAWAGSVEIALGTAGLIIVYRAKSQQLSHWYVTLACAKRLLKTSWPLILAGMAIMIYMRIDQIMLGEMVDDRAVGIYAAATRLSELWYFVPMAITSSVFPAIVEAKKTGEAVYYQGLQRLFDLMAAISLAIAIPMTFFSEAIIQLLYHENFAGAGAILTIHIWTALFVFMGVAQSPWDVTEGLTQLALKRTVAGAVIKIVLNLVLIPLYAGLGAAISMVIAQAFSACLTNVVDKRTRRIFVLQIQSLFVLKYLRKL